MIEMLPHVNASLNSVATLLLVIGYVLIRSRKEQAHKVAMLSAFAVSCVFLICYLFYHANVGSKKFPTVDYDQIWYVVYLLILIPHIILAMSVPVLGLITIWLGLKIDLQGQNTNPSPEFLQNQGTIRRKHRKIARITFPIWLYVSVTGVLVYLYLYWWFPPISELTPVAG